ncbi:ferritin-like domain-containing protein [Paracoccaceae bacterium Fryx2]|nr:ferritin-like domain-containing protein [Paracoccaceae bacterium Fryx2]
MENRPMPTDTIPAPTALKAVAHETLVTSLRNAHALEKQVIAVLEPQLKQLTDFPELHARLSEHVRETREQARRLEAGLETCGASTSMVKDALLSVMGFGQSSIQGFSDDAVLKAVVADMMTEHLEIATYRTLLVLADMAGKPDLRPRLEASLREEEAMAEWFDQNLDAITHRFVEVKAVKEAKAAAAAQEKAAAPAPATPRPSGDQAPAAGAAPRPATPADRSSDT